VPHRRPRLSTSRVGDGKVWVAPIEYVILRDVASMLRISGDTVKWDVMHRWSDRVDLQKTLELARQDSPD
jgi:hypothetical protein